MSLNTILATAPLTTSGYHIKANGTTLGNSLIWDNGTNVGIGNTNTSYTLDVSGTGRFTGTLIAANSLLVNATAQNGTDSKIYVKQSSDSSFRGVNIVSSTSAEYVGGMFMDGSGNFNIAQSYLGSGSYQSLTFLTSGTERMRITSGGIVTITGNSGSLVQQAGTVGGDVYHEFKNSAGTRRAFLGFGGASSSVFDIWNSENGDMKFATNNTERMRITSGGNVGIGTNSPDSKLQVAGTCKIDSTLYSTSEIVLGSSGSYPVGGVGFRNDGINLNIYYGANNCIFKDVTNVERMRITSGGQVQIKQSANTFADGFRLISSNSIYWGLVVGGDNNLYLGYNSPSASIGVFNYATGIYTATSDINKKKDFEDSTIGLNAILGLKPKLFRMKSENNEVEKSLGFIAQEVKEFIPQAYVDSNNFIGLNDRPIIAALVKAIQEMNTKLDEQNQLITSLQDRLDKAGL